MTVPSTTEPQGSCILCFRRDPYRSPVCDACRSWLPGVVADIRIKAELLSRPESVVRDDRLGKFTRRHWVRDIGWVDTTDEGWRDPVAHAQPAAPVTGKGLGRMYSRSAPGSRPPLPLDRLDLTATARVPNPPRGYGGYPRSWWPEDQIGQQPVATVLESWVRDWVEVRDLREHRPEPTVDVLTRWLVDRCDWACDEHPAVDEFADEMFHLRGRLGWSLGETDRPDYKVGVACPRCHALTLIQRNGCEYVECGSDACPAMLSPAEYSALTVVQARAVLDGPAIAA